MRKKRPALAGRSNVLASLQFCWLCFVLALLQAGEVESQFAFGKKTLDYELSDVLPDAETFVRQDNYWEGYAGKEDGPSELIGYVLLSDDLTQIPGYSGQSINTLLGMDPSGMLTGVKIVEHSEPIVLLGLSEEVIHDFARQYVGKNIRDRIIISNSPREGYTAVDAIAGATVTAIAENATILEAGRMVAIQAGMLPARMLSSNRLSTEFRELAWDDLVEEGAITNLVIRPRDVSSEGEESIIDLWFTILNPPAIGKNILGEHSWKLIEERVEKGEIALYIGSSGSISFKGSGFARGGIFDRFSLEQGTELFLCKDIDYVNLPSIAIEGGVDFDEGGIFFLGESFDPTQPFTFHLTIPYRVNDVRNYATFTKEFVLPSAFIDEEASFWSVRWRTSAGYAVSFALFVAFVVLLFAQIRRVASKTRLLTTFQVASWAIAAVIVGLYLRAQPSTTQILTFFTSAVHLRFPLEIYLSEPIIFLFWITIIVSTPFWGRGFFCGWLCPYGALLDLLRKLWSRFAPDGIRAKIDHWSPPPSLRFVKYGILFFILVASLFSLASAEILAEVEPFKTFILQLRRPAHFVAYFAVVTLASVIVYRLFCRFLCPLGAALAIPSRRPFKTLDRYEHCRSCRICERECPSNAIEKGLGRIDHSECFHCWTCQAIMQNRDRCPVLIRKERAEKPHRHTVVAALLLLPLFVASLPARTWVVADGYQSFQDVMELASDGDTLDVKPGIYSGPVRVSKELTVVGEERAVLDGQGKGHVVIIDSPVVTLRGFEIRGSGDDIENADAGIWVAQNADSVLIINNTIVDCRFGIWVHGSRDIRIVGNRIEGRAQQDQNQRGDGIHFWDARGARVERNVITDSRDGIYMELSTDCEILGNEIRRSRYSVHTMWCDRNKYNENVASENLVGLALMFSKGLEAKGNTLHNNVTHGLLLIQVTRSTVENNLIIGNTKGLFIYNSLYNTIRGNLVGRNSLGIHYWAGSEDNEIHDNTLIQNKIQVKYVAARDQEWNDNYWSDYIGWDMDNNGRGDTPYRSHTLVDALLWDYPAAKLLLASPSLQLLAQAETTFPVISVPKVIDTSPRMEPLVSDWASIVERFPPVPQDYYGPIAKLPHIPGR